MRRKKIAQYIEEAEDEEEANRHDKRCEEINSELEKLKNHMQKQDKVEGRKQVIQLTEETNGRSRGMTSDFIERWKQDYKLRCSMVEGELEEKGRSPSEERYMAERAKRRRVARNFEFG